MRINVALSLFLLLSAAGMVVAPHPAAAQANCRQSCMNDENACLQRTGNKGQCGHRSSDCMAKCR